MIKKDLEVLVVDDHMLMRNIVEKHLNALNIRKIAFAKNGVEALEKTKEKIYDIIITDVNMPELSGKELLIEVKKNEAYNKSAFFIISSASEKLKVLELISLGATAYLNKPFSNEEFETIIEDVFSWLNKVR